MSALTSVSTKSDGLVPSYETVVIPSILIAED